MNPELRRNLWLEFSLHRLLAMPAAIALGALLMVATNEPDARAAAATMAAFGFVALVMLWGTQLAGGSVIEEARARTWDAQRMSAIEPWTMTWGKLAGAPSFAWYGGAMLLLIFVLAGRGQLQFPVLRTSLVMAAVAVFLHAMALNASVFATRKGATQRGAGGMALILIMFLLMFPAIDLMSGHDKEVAWWRLRVTQVDFLLATAAAYAAWAVLGAYRSMCTELEIRTLPWAFPLFIGFTAIYAAGFLVRGQAEDMAGTNAILFSGTTASLGAMYLLLFTEQAGTGVWQRLVGRCRSRQWRRALQEMPVWLVALVMGLAFAATSMLLPAAMDKSALLREFQHAPLAIALFAVRDAALFQFFALARQPRRAEAAALFYLVLLYWLVPVLLSAFGASALAEFILPPLLARPGFSTVVVAAQAAATIWLALWRWQQHHAMDRDAPASGRAG